MTPTGKHLSGSQKTFRKELGLFARQRLDHCARTDTAGTHTEGAYGTVGELMAHLLQVGIEAAFGLDVRVAHKIADLRFLSAEIAFSAHGGSSVYGN